MSAREKTLWISLVSMLAVWGWYFSGFVSALDAGRVDQGIAVGNFIHAVILIVAINVTAAIVLSIMAGREADSPADDRERGFATAAYRPAYLVLVVLVALIMLAAPVGLRFITETGLAVTPDVVPVAIGNALLFALLVSETVHAGWQLFHFRRQAWA